MATCTATLTVYTRKSSCRCIHFCYLRLLPCRDIRGPRTGSPGSVPTQMVTVRAGIAAMPLAQVPLEPWGKVDQPRFPQVMTLMTPTGFLSWFRNGLLATGVGVISYMQSDTGREAAYGFFILGGVCISYGSGSYIANLFLLRRMMMLSVPTALVSGLVVGAVALFWLCAVSLYIGRLEVEIIHDEECEDCKSKEGKNKSD
eukprot:g41713.t1